MSCSLKSYSPTYSPIEPLEGVWTIAHMGSVSKVEACRLRAQGLGASSLKLFINTSEHGP